MTIIKIKVYGRDIGEYDDTTGIYKSYPKTPEYVMGKFGGGGSFGISQIALDELKKLGCHTVMMPYHGKTCKKLLKTSLDQWFKSPHKYLDKGIDWQKFVCINDSEDLLAKKEEVKPTTIPAPLPPSAIPTKQTRLKW